MTAPLEALPEPRALTHPEIRTIVLGIMLAMFLGALDQTIVATALIETGSRADDFIFQEFKAALVIGRADHLPFLGADAHTKDLDAFRLRLFGHLRIVELSLPADRAVSALIGSPSRR